MFGLGMGEILIILAAALIFIGPKKLPELARGLGKGLKEFQNAAKGITSVISDPVKDTVDNIKNDITKDIPNLKDDLLDDPNRDHGEDFVSAEEIVNLPGDLSPEHDESGESINEKASEESKENKPS